MREEKGCRQNLAYGKKIRVQHCRQLHGMYWIEKALWKEWELVKVIMRRGTSNKMRPKCYIHGTSSYIELYKTIFM